MSPRPQPRRGRPKPDRRSAPAPRRSARRDDSELGGEQVEGRQAVRALLVAGSRRTREVWIAEEVGVARAGVADAGVGEAGVAGAGGRSGPLAEIMSLAQSRRVPVRFVPRARLDAAAGTDAPQGVLAYAEAVAVADLDDLIRPGGGGDRPFLVVLDGITDPHNVGAILRSAVGAGATGAVIARHRASRLGPAALKAAAGAVEYLPIALVAGIPATLAALRQAQVWTVGLDADGPSELWGMTLATEALALVLGAEGRGLARLTRDRCDLVVRIPMSGPLESLNVAAAAALACFEVARRRAG